MVASICFRFINRIPTNQRVRGKLVTVVPIRTPLRCYANSIRDCERYPLVQAYSPAWAQLRLSLRRLSHLAGSNEVNSTSSELRLFVDAPASPESTSFEQISTRWLLSTACSLLVVFAGCVVLAGYQPPLWLQPTIVGLFWGFTFLLGFAIGSFGRGSLQVALLVAGLAWLMDQGCVSITDLARSDCLLMTSLLLASGWAVARVDRVHALPLWTEEQDRISQWSIGDILFATTVAACLAESIVHLVPTMLLLSALLALAGGVVCSWFAYRWAWLNRWSIASVMVAVVGLVAAVIYVDQVAPVDATLWECIAWLCIGPVNVIASQATTVLFLFALVRFEASLLRRDGVTLMRVG